MNLWYGSPHRISTVLKPSNFVAVQHLQLDSSIGSSLESSRINMGMLVLFPQLPEQYVKLISSVVSQSPLFTTFFTVCTLHVAVKKREILFLLLVGWLRIFYATFNNISVISWCSVLLVAETRVPKEKSHWQTLSHNVISSTPIIIKMRSILYSSWLKYCWKWR